MEKNRLLEVVVSATAGQNPAEVAREWLRRLPLSDGVRITVVLGAARLRSRKFVAYDGRVISVQEYAALMIADALEELVRGESRALDAWEILQLARRRGSPIAEAPVATISRAARLLARDRRLRAGSTPGTWVAARRDESAA